MASSRHNGRAVLAVFVLKRAKYLKGCLNTLTWGPSSAIRPRRRTLGISYFGTHRDPLDRCRNGWSRNRTLGWSIVLVMRCGIRYPNRRLYAEDEWEIQKFEPPKGTGSRQVCRPTRQSSGGVPLQVRVHKFHPPPRLLLPHPLIILHAPNLCLNFIGP